MLFIFFHHRTDYVDHHVHSSYAVDDTSNQLKKKKKHHIHLESARCLDLQDHRLTVSDFKGKKKRD